jgi:hypothetical protein
MNSPDWKDLERLWQSSAATAPVLEIIAKQHRRRWLRGLLLYSELMIVIAGLVFSVWVMTHDRPYALLAGGGTLLVTVFAGLMTLWARLPRRAQPDDNVALALETAIHRARVSVRWGLASFWLVPAYLAFFAVMAFAWAMAPAFPHDVARRLLVAFGFAMAWTAFGQLFATVYYLKRSRELARLEEIKRALAGE